MRYILIILLVLIPCVASAQVPGPPPPGDLTGDNVTLDTTNFDNNLGPGDTDVQKALDTLDDTAGGSGISYSNAQSMFVDSATLTWDTSESQVIVGTVVGGGGVSYGNVITVATSGGDYTSISAAITGESPTAGDLIRVMPGTYTETAAITVPAGVGIAGVGEKPIIDFTDTLGNTGFQGQNVSSPTSTTYLLNLHIKVSSSVPISYGGNLIDYDLIAKDCKLEMKDTTTTGGSFISLTNAKNAFVDNCEFVLSQTAASSNEKWGVSTYNITKLVLKNSTFSISSDQDNAFNIVENFGSTDANEIFIENNSVNISCTKSDYSEDIRFLYKSTGANCSRYVVRNNEVKIETTQTTGTCNAWAYYITPTAALNVESYNNKIIIKGFTTNYFCLTDTVNASFDSISDWIEAADGNDITLGTFNQDYSVINDVFADGKLTPPTLLDSTYITWDTTEIGTAKPELVTTNIVNPSSFVDSATLTWDTSETGVVTATSTSGISKADVQGMMVDTDSAEWDTSEADIVRVNIPEAWVKGLFPSYVQNSGLIINTSEVEVVDFSIDDTIIPSFSSFVDSDSLTWDTSEAGVIVGTASGIDSAAVQSLFVDSASLTWDTSETGVIIGTAAGSGGGIDTDEFLEIHSASVMDICQNMRGLWMMNGATTALTGESYAQNDGMLTGGLTFATDRSDKGNGYSLLFNGSTDYIDLGDSDDFSFGSGTSDEAFSICALVNVVDDANEKYIISKSDETTGSEKREWYFRLRGTEKLQFVCVDESANDTAYIFTNTALSEGYHFVSATYDGSSLATGMKLYVDGIEITDVSRNTDAGYVAMENLTTDVFVGAYTGTAAIGGFFPSYMSFVAIEKSEMTASEVYRLWKLVKGIYGL